MSAEKPIMRCQVCMGKKKIRGLGMIEKTCPECLGIGWVSMPEPIAEKVKNIIAPNVTLKKRGRKKKR